MAVKKQWGPIPQGQGCENTVTILETAVPKINGLRRDTIHPSGHRVPRLTVDNDWRGFTGILA